MTIDFAAAIAAATGDGSITGASFAYWDGATLHTAVGGRRNSVTGDPVTLDTLMHIGSITKVINATLFMQLVDDGLITLDDLVAKHLPDLRLGDAKALETLTCRMLINHTSGIDFDCPDYEDFEQQRIEVAIRQCATRPQIHAPGEATAYSNIGTVIAGHIAQTLRGRGWYELIKERIFEPLGLTHSLVDVTDLPRFRVSVGDQVDGEGRLVQSIKPFLTLSFAPAGATVMMNASDLVTFARALINGGVGVNGTRILSEASARAMATETAAFASPPDWRIGLGWMLLPGGVLSHGGGGPGVASELYVHPASGRAFALLTNCSKTGAFAESLVQPMLAAWGAVAEPRPVLPDLGAVAAYEGDYENQLMRYEVFGEENGLFVRLVLKVNIYETDSARTPVYRLERIGEHLFRMSLDGAVAPMPIAFVGRGADGRMQRLATGVRLFNRV